MGPLGDQIRNYRAAFIQKLTPLALAYYQDIANKDEIIQIKLNSGFNQDHLVMELKSNRLLDIKARKTTHGIHRDDILFMINDLPFKKYGSQGQIKSLLLALRLAQLDIIKDEIDKEPILIIDDVFDKLDIKRINHLLNYIKSNPQRQFFCILHQ